MRAYVIAVGDELLGPARTDTNSLWLADHLGRLDVSLTGKAVVGDDRDRICRAVEIATADADLVIVTGGLGPTADDLTREGVSDALSLGLGHDDTVAAAIERRFADHGVRMAEVNLRQAQVPEGATVLENRRGTAPGLRLEADGCTLFLLAGVPHEMRGLARAFLLPWVEKHSGTGRTEVQIFRIACLPEATVEERLQPLYERVGAERVAVLARPGDVRVEVRSRPQIDAPVAPDLVRELLGDSLYSEGASLAEVVLDVCRSAGLRLAVAESCTGGLVCARLTAIPGSSEVLLGGVVAYDNRIKRNLLGVSQYALQKHGAVSEEVAVEMAEGARKRLTADIGVSVTGIAGPGGGSVDKPVGTVCFGWADAAGADATRVRLPGDRRWVRAYSVQYALDGVRRRVGS